MKQKAVYPADFLLPAKDTDLTKWAVVACDQFTSQQDYWDAVEAYVGDAPSTLRLTLPEIYLGTARESRQAQIPATMEKYLKEGILQPFHGFVYIQRTLEDGSVRSGLLAQIDLEAYDPDPGKKPAVSATEATVLNRLPPRVAIRRQSPLEVPHILLVLCDEKQRVLEPLKEKTGDMEKLYDFDLMQDGGRIRGYRIPDGETVLAALDEVWEDNGEDGPFLLVGDGNHSLAAAKQYWETVRESLPEEEREGHPARYALCEIINLYEDSLRFEPIYRVAFHVEDPRDLAQAFADYLDREEGSEGYAEFMVAYAGGYATLSTDALPTVINAETVDRFLEDYTEKHPGITVDYVHGYRDVIALSETEHVAAFIHAPLAKEDLPWYISRYGILPKKTFSMGHAREKRYYLECRKITR